ncbi:MAG: polysaccharide deacetylase 2 family uncharacterized protein YibQ [Oceanicoccus sp.]|jgi:polysaccharide deacetylase 2 family uncharacterized protein YibQ
MFNVFLLPTRQPNTVTASAWLRLLVIGCLLLPLCGFADNSATVVAPPTTNIVIIIDDMGNSLALGQRAIALPGPLNFAFLPHSPHTVELANAAAAKQQEVMLHIPMTNLQNYATGPGTLTPAMSKQQFQKTLADNISAVPHVRGVNNHMGSLLTQLRQPMSWLMASLKQQQLYFIDSRTSPLTVAEQTANKQRLPTLRRDIFLDNDRSETAIGEQFNKLLALARKQGQALAIGHPYPETLAFLETALPNLAEQGFRLVLASQALKQRNKITAISVGDLTIKAENTALK